MHESTHSQLGIVLLSLSSNQFHLMRSPKAEYALEPVWTKRYEEISPSSAAWDQTCRPAQSYVLVA